MNSPASSRSTAKFISQTKEEKKMKEKYTGLELEIIRFSSDDVIVTSFTDGGNQECPTDANICFSNE